MPKYRKRPVVIDAVQYTGDNIEEIWDFATAEFVYGPVDGNDPYVMTLEGNMRFKPGHWIIRGVNGEYYPCEPDVFAKTYELAEIDGITRQDTLDEMFNRK